MADNNKTANATNTDTCIIEPPEVLMLIIGSLSALLNGLLLLVMFNERKKFFRTRVSYLVASLSCADCFTGVAVALIIVRQMTQWQWISMDIQFLLVSVSIQISFLTLVLMSIDRLVVAVFLMTWSKILSVRRTIVAVSLAWLVSVFAGIMQRYYTRTRRFALLLFWQITVLFFISVHVFIFRFLKKQRRRLLHSGGSREVSVAVDLPLQVSHVKITSIVLTLMLVLVITYIPYIICLSITVATTGTTMEIHGSNTALRYTQAFSYLNYAVNPIVYAWRLRIYRKAFCQMFKLI